MAILHALIGQVVRLLPICYTSIGVFSAIVLHVFPVGAQIHRGPQPDIVIDVPTRLGVIQGVLKAFGDHYVFPEVAQEAEESIRLRLQRKEYDGITSAKALAETMTTDLRAVTHDVHAKVLYSSIPLPQHEQSEPTPAQMEQYQRDAAVENFGFEKVERLSGNVGYLELRSFADPGIAASTAVAAMNFLTNTEALIIDLRQNGGGSPEMVALLSSYLFDSGEPVHLNDIYHRPDNSTRQFWTLPYVPGRLYLEKEVYILTSRGTFSAGEEFAYNLKHLKRATLVGETTGGGANPGELFRVGKHFDVFVPTGRAINPITKTNWEGSGVKPDIEVPAEQALKTAHQVALRNLTQKATDEKRKQELQKMLQEAEQTRP
ncbi:MAG: S41 family peptidase [Gemmatimonadaceae bacterium]|nr:S41 family peptidase [Gloeobacterales cyanobacterium ES-bin-141]